MIYVVWFKKDLRWHDHAALANAAMWASEDQKRGREAFAKTGPNTAVFEGT